MRLVCNQKGVVSRPIVELELTGFGGFEGVELLQKLHLFKLLTFDETTRLGGLLEYVDVAEGTVLIEQNALGDALYVIARGEVRVSRDVDGDGQHQASEELGRLGPGEVFGEMALFDDVLTSARVTAVGPCRLLRLPRAAFERLLQEDDHLAVKVYRSFCRTLSDRLRRTSTLLARSQAMQVSVR
jgi:CRP/FNR family transcriptional regulator